MTREDFIQGLRDAADVFQAHPELPLNIAAPLTVNIFVQDKAELASIARAGTWEKAGNDSYFWIRRQIGALSYEVNIDRAQMCRRVVKGKVMIPAQEIEEVEWICDEPVLAAGGLDDGVRR